MKLVFNALLQNDETIIPKFHKYIYTKFEEYPLYDEFGLDILIDQSAYWLVKDISNLQYGQTLLTIIRNLPDLEIEELTSLDLEIVWEAAIFNRGEVGLVVWKLRAFYRFLISLMLTEKYGKDNIWCHFIYIIYVRILISENDSDNVKKQKLFHFASIIYEYFLASIRILDEQLETIFKSNFRI